MKPVRSFALAAAVALGSLAGTAATAQEWPSRPVRIINTFAPGGAADILARLAADHLSGALGQQFFVETRAGAGGVIGVQFVAHAEPDGYNSRLDTVNCGYYRHHWCSDIRHSFMAVRWHSIRDFIYLLRDRAYFALSSHF